MLPYIYLTMSKTSALNCPIKSREYYMELRYMKIPHTDDRIRALEKVWPGRFSYRFEEFDRIHWSEEFKKAVLDFCQILKPKQGTRFLYDEAMNYTNYCPWQIGADSGWAKFTREINTKRMAELFEECHRGIKKFVNSVEGLHPKSIWVTMHEAEELRHVMLHMIKFSGEYEEVER